MDVAAAIAAAMGRWRRLDYCEGGGGGVDIEVPADSRTSGLGEEEATSALSSRGGIESFGRVSSGKSPGVNPAPGAGAHPAEGT